MQSRFGDVFAYNVNSGAWSSKAAMPTARSEAWLGVIGNLAHLMGGSGNPANQPNGTFAQHEVYNFARDIWTTLPDMPNPRHGPVTAVVGNTIYLPGGSAHQTVGVTPIFNTYSP